MSDEDDKLDKKSKAAYTHAAGLNPSNAVANKWICYMPLASVLGDAYPNLELQTTQFYLPRIEVTASTVAFQGYTIKVPSARTMNAGDKTIKFQYIIDDEWRNYTSLYTWASKFADYGYAVEKGGETHQLAGLSGSFATVRLWLLSPFKKRIVDFQFEDCWVQEFGDILLDVASSEPVKHNFTLAYSQFKIVDIPPTSGNRADNNPDFI